MSNQDRAPSNALPFVTPSSLWPPRLISEVSAWNQHVPFAGWIIEATRPRVFVELGTHIGVSYFAFCESAARLELGTRCYAVDTWVGDEHAGYYGEQVFRSVQKINSTYYDAFSRLMRTTFDEAVEEFDDGSIDLLHLDGLHTYEASRHDFETWLPKLSDRAVMLFHDTNERKEDFGVHRLLSELRQQYPTFEFGHEHGLGVVCIGQQVPDAVADLVALNQAPAMATQVRGIYESLGRRLSAEHHQSLLTTTVKQQGSTLAAREAKLAEFTKTVAKRDAKLAEFAKTVAKRDAKLAEFTQTIAKRDRTLAVREAKLREYAKTVAKRDAKVAELVRTVAGKDTKLAQMAKAKAAQESQLAALDTANAAQKQRIDALEGTLRKRTQALSASRKQTKAVKRSLSRLRSRRSVRIALAISRPIRPLFRVVRGRKKSRSHQAAAPPKADNGAAPAALDSPPPAQTVTPVPQSYLLSEVSQPENVVIVVPVFNAPEELNRCLRSLVNHTTGNTSLLIIDDASTDERIEPIVETYAKIDGVEVLTNEENLGFVKTVNRGFSETEGDVVIVNSDVEVTPGWLDRLRLAALLNPDAGTITPLSNNAGAFSAPEVGKPNKLPDGLSGDEIGRLIAQSARRTYPRGPTGNGFCMYVRRACLDDVGLFDAEAFPRGYGEENDFCMKALAKGWANVVDDTTYVFHARSASFGDEKQELAAAGRQVLDDRYPEYGPLVREFLASPGFVTARGQVAGVFEKVMSRKPRPRPRVLFVLHRAGGGTPATTRDLALGLDSSYESFVLVADGSLITLTRFDRNKAHEVGKWALSQRISVTDSGNSQYREIVQSVLIDNAIDIVHVRHLIGHTFELPGIARSLGIPVVFSFHDFYYICPTVHLMDDKDSFCGGVCSPGQGHCPTPTPWLAGLPHLKHSWVYDWRKRVADMFQDVALFITASQSTKDFYVRAFPDLREQRFEVIEHGRALEIAEPPVGEEPARGGPIRILLPGNIGPHKGSGFVEQLAELDTGGRLEFHLLGKTVGGLNRIVTHHGTYDRSDFEPKARTIGPSFVGLFSTTAESFSHVLTEAWAAGIPVLASRLGALEDRVEKHGGGWLLDVDDPISSYRRILEIADDPESYRIQRDRATEAARLSRSLSDMAGDYGEVYSRLRQERRSFVADNDPIAAGAHLLRVGVFVPGGQVEKDIKPPGHIRVLRRLIDPAMVDRIAWTLSDVEAFVAGTDGPPIDVAIVHRTAVPSAIVDEFIEKCNTEGIGIVFDIDDDLLSDDPTWTEADLYEPFAHSLETLISAAATVTVSTTTLADRIDGRNANTVVLENALDRSMWLQPLVGYSQPPDSPAAIEKSAGPRLLFAGGMTHKADLEILRPAIEMVQEELETTVDLYVVGGVSATDRETWYKSLDVPSGHGYYPRFVPWLRSMADSFDIALAPLVDNRINDSKSDLRFLEYAALGLPGIYSRCSAFSSVEDGTTGLVVEDSAQRWAEAIVRLWTDQDLMKHIRANALEYVAGHRLITHQHDQFLAYLWMANRKRRADV